MHISISAETLTEIWGIPITNAVVAGFIVSVVLIAFAILFRRKISYIPGKLQSMLEALIGFFYDIAKSMSPKHAHEFFPLVMTLFIFILISNWSGLIPGISAIGMNEVHHGEEIFVPLYRAATSDLNTTLALALISIIAVQYYSIKHLGLKSHLSKFFVFTDPVGFFVGILEIISEFAKIISFAFRLFGNIFAGEVLLVVVTALIPVLVPLPFLGLEIFVGFIQAVVFAVLTTVFIGSALEVHQA